MIREFSFDKRNIVGLIGLAANVVEEAIQAEKDGANCLDVRCDELLNQHIDLLDVLPRIREHTNVPLIGTFRIITHECGKWCLVSTGSEAQRLAHYLAIIPYVDGVDIEYHARIRDEVARAAKEQGKFVIDSWSHWGFEKPQRIHQRIHDMTHENTDVLKMMYLVGKNEDFDRLVLHLCDYHKQYKKPLSLTGMGIRGRLSPYVLPFYGSCFTYGRVAGQNPTRGESTIKQIKTFFDHIKQENPNDVDAFAQLVRNYNFQHSN